MSRKQSPRTMALAFFIWSTANKEGWNITISDLADAAAEYFNDAKITVGVIRGICHARRKGGQTWLGLLRVTSPGGEIFNEARVA